MRAPARPGWKRQVTVSNPTRLGKIPRQYKLSLMRKHGITTGRQWVKLRKRLQREERAKAQGVAL